MSSSSYSYDEESTHAPFFILTLAAIFAVPITYSILKSSTDLENTGTRVETDFRPKDEDLIQAQRRKQKRKELKIKRIVSATILWTIIGYMIYLIATTQIVAPKLWDPYDVLGVSRSATEKEIDRHYKRMAIKYHPDKATPDASQNETLDTVNDRWVEMTKAYKTLTDEEIRNNYLQYGNPDGKQSTNVGIAIPAWVIGEGYRWGVIGFYAALLGVLLPYLLGKWWYGTQALTKDKVLIPSAAKMFKAYKEDLTEGGALYAISAADEFKQILKGAKADTGAAKVESAVVASGMLSKADVERLQSVEDPVQRKTLCLLWAYLCRIDLKDDELKRQMYEVVPTALHVNQSFSNITLPFFIAQPLINSYQTAQNLIQALPPDSPPVLQLPNFTSSLARSISESSSKSPLTVQKLMALPAQVRRSMCSALSDKHYNEAMHFASQIPHLTVEKAFFKVVGDKVVTPGSLVQLVVKARVIPPGTAPASVPKVNPDDLEDADPDEDDVDQLSGRKPPTRKRRNSEGRPVDLKTTETSVQPPLAMAPYFPADHAPRWHIFLSEARSGRIAVPPFTFTSFDKPIFTAEGKPTFEVVTLKCQFQAPPQVHAFNFTMQLVCDSYAGFDSKTDVVLDVRDLEEAAVVESDGEISEPGEDTLAGQLEALRTGEAPKRRAKQVDDDDDEDDSDDDDESDTDGSDNDTSETDTETEDEEDAKKK